MTGILIVDARNSHIQRFVKRVSQSLTGRGQRTTLGASETAPLYCLWVMI